MRRAFVWLLLLVAGCGGRERFRGAVTPEATRAEPLAGGGTSVAELAAGSSAPRVTPDQVGLATWYGQKFAGRRTASGERFDPRLYTAAHRKLPFGTWVEVRRVDTGRTVRVRVNDRGPWGDDRRVIDLAQRAAEDLGLVREGITRVELRVVSGP